jgi:glycosyltransferase involved in cell wall biosynthesis
MRKKIMILVDWFEPGYKAGGPIQSCRNLVKALEDVYDLYVLTSDRDLGDPVPYNGIDTNVWIDYSPHTKVYYAPVEQLTKAATREIIHAIDPFCIYLNSMYSWHFTIIPLILKRTGAIRCPVLIAPRGMLQRGAMQFKPVKKKLFISLLNFASVASRVYFHATDEEEKKDILSHFPRTRGVKVIGNFPAMDTGNWSQTEKKKNVLHLVFLSRIAPKKNLLFLLTSLQTVSKDRTVYLHVFGESEDAAYLEKCKNAVRQLPAHVHVQWHGALPNREISKAYRTMHVFALPTFGENFGHAIYEAMALGKPVIISDKTPWKNLQEKKAGIDISLEQPDAFKNAIEHFAAIDQNEYDAWSKGAWQYASDFRSNNQLRNEYLQLFSEQFLKQ